MKLIIYEGTEKCIIINNSVFHNSVSSPQLLANLHLGAESVEVNKHTANQRIPCLAWNLKVYHFHQEAKWVAILS
jgi:hypothetical protein